jgi:ABC-type multidrug transport system fused ATPase/permease subunit
MIPVLGLFAAAAFRLLPSVNRLVTGMQGVRFTAAVVDSLYADLMLPRPHASERSVVPLSFSDELVIDALSYRYPLASSNAVDGVSLRIPHGSSIGLIGGSGAGKSTLVDVILGLLTPTSGRVLVDGIDIQSNIRGWQSIIGYVPQTIFLADDTLRRNVAFGLPEELIDDDAVRRALRAAQLESFVAELPEGWNTGVGERGVRLSGGQRQRIGIARALYHDPQVLVLDEATSALDTETEAGVMADVEALHGAKTLIIVAHRLSTVRNCDVLYRFERGRMAQAGSFAEVIGS